MKLKKIMFVIFSSMIYCYGFDLSQLTRFHYADKIHRTITDFAPHTYGCLIDSNVIFEVKGFLYITKKLCGIESNLAINCPSVQYSVRLGITDESKDNPFFFDDAFNVGWYRDSLIAEKCRIKLPKPFFQVPSEYSFNGLGMFLRPNQYPKLKNIHQNIEKELENKTYIIVPVSLKINNIVLGYSASTPHFVGLFDIKEILPLSEQEKQDILKQRCKDSSTYIDTNKINYCAGDMSDDKIYPFSKDLYINMREKPDTQSKVIARLASVAPKGDEYAIFKVQEIYLSDDDFPVFGFLFPMSTTEKDIDLATDAVNNVSWLVNRAKFLQKNPDVKIVKAQTISIMKNYGFVDNEQIELYTKGLPVNGWYRVYFIDKNNKKVEGYIHKSQLSWGF